MAEQQNAGKRRAAGGGGRGPVDKKPSMQIYISGAPTMALARTARKLDQHLVDVNNASVTGSVSLERYQSMLNDLFEQIKIFDREFEELRREQRRELNLGQRRRRSGQSGGNQETVTLNKREDRAGSKGDQAPEDEPAAPAAGARKKAAAKKKVATRAAPAEVESDAESSVGDLLGGD